MFRNMFWFDRALRSALGLIVLTMAYIGSQVILYVVGGILLTTGVIGFCPVLALAGQNEAETEKTPEGSVHLSGHVA